VKGFGRSAAGLARQLAPERTPGPIAGRLSRRSAGSGLRYQPEALRRPNVPHRDPTAWLWMQASSNRSPRGKFPSIREKNREFCKFEGFATTCARTNTRHFRRFSSKFPVRIEPGILLSNREFFLSNREIFKCENGKPARSRALRLVSPRQGKARLPSYARPLPTRGEASIRRGAREKQKADSRITDNIKRWRLVTIAMMSRALRPAMGTVRW
jgi:hypothetical protein